MNTDAATPRPCPFCNSTDLDTTRWGHGGHYIVCNTCRAYGPDADTGVSWNDRDGQKNEGKQQ